MNVPQPLRDFLIENSYAKQAWTDNNLFLQAAKQALDDGKLTGELFNELTGQKSGKVTPRNVFGGGDVRLKRPSEQYKSTKSVAKHARTGKEVRDERSRQVETVSEMEYAKAGALLKYRAAHDGVPSELSEHERELVAEMFEADKWCGKVGGQYETGIAGSRVKTLLNDSQSGGRELVPEWFDAAVVQFPLLHSELLPRVDLRDVPRGSAVETASVGNPTASWGTNEGTAIQPFDTASLVAGIDVTIHPVTCAVEIGRDFMQDSAANIGQVLVENVGQRLMAELDRVIAKGSGINEPIGIVNSSMVDIGNPAGGAGAAPQVNDYEELMFSVGKQYRNPSMRPAFVMNDITYSRARGIAVGASDARRVFGMDEGSYRLLEHDVLIQNDLGNAYAAFCCMAKFRLYRRLAQSIEFVSGGRELALTNKTMLVVRGRYGSKLVDSNAAAFSDNFQA